jgi:hypothetical protein
MKSFRHLDEFKNTNECDIELKRVFNEIYPDPNKVKSFWTFLDETVVDFFDRCPITVSQFKNMGLTVKHCYMISIVDYEHGGIHIDYRADPVRIHWPVHNTDSVVTKWFKYDGDINECPIWLADGVGPEYVHIDSSKCTLIDEHCFNGPTAFRVDIPHCATAIQGKPLPRMAFSFSFVEQDRVNSLLT